MTRNDAPAPDLPRRLPVDDMVTAIETTPDASPAAVDFDAALAGMLRAHGPDVHAVLGSARGERDEAYLAEVALAKRFVECWTFDPSFREAFTADAAGALAARGLALAPEAARLLAGGVSPEGAGGAPRAVRRFRAMRAEARVRRRAVRFDADVAAPIFASWRRREVRRIVQELGPGQGGHLTRYAVAFELQQGCSVGCWFCGVSAARLAEVWRYTPGNAALWRDVLRVCREVLGPVTRRGLCYWASDPLDNPDYHRFAEDFETIVGRYPSMSTAIPLRDREATLRVLRHPAPGGPVPHRFSILSLRQLREVHASFTARELLDVELEGLHRESPMPKAAAGRARTIGSSGRGVAPADAYSTIACLSGFLFNMVERSVRLVTPCRASDRWPDGSRDLASGRFDDAESLRLLLPRLLDRADGGPVADDADIAFRSGLGWTHEDGRIVARSGAVRHRFAETPALAAVVETLRTGAASPVEIARRLAATDGGVPVGETLRAVLDVIALLDRRGLLSRSDDGRAAAGPD